ncbi:Serum response factor-binding protein 1 [Gryllus bimaculatus]|nr:Serum response factor-binding protein 1 [Gryllus bimaculatus]
MNPAEKVKTILDTLTIPWSKDDPFGQGGRNLKFDGSCFDLRSVTFQGFVNRISTFKPEDWSSDPNAAIFLSKYGFKAVSGSKVCCCCCGIEVDVGVFLRNRDVLRTIAIQSHKQYCRWLHVSIPEEYFCIPKNPFRGLQDLKVTFTDMMTFQTSIPLIVKDNWVKMGISEAFMMSVLNFLEQTYSDILASCVVLSLCGWVKRNEKSLQCNFCQRVVGVWSFISDNVTRSLPVERPSKHSRVISLLYSEIRRSMELSEDSEIVEVNCEGTPDSTVEAPSEEPPSEEPPSEEPPSEEPLSEEPPSEEPPSEEPPSEEPLSEEPPSEQTQSMETSFTEMPSAEMSSVEIPSAETPTVEIPSAESLSMEHHPVKPPAVTHVKHAVKPPRVKPPRVKPSRVELPLVEPPRVAPPCVEPTPMKPTPLEPSSEEPEIVYEGTTKRNQGGPSSVHENKSMLKDPQLPPYYPNMMADSDLELTTRMRNEAIPGNQCAWTRLCEKKGPSDFSSECVSDKAKKQSKVEFKSNNNGASKDENGFYSTEPNVREETYSQSIKSVNSSLEQDTIVISSGSEKRSSNNSCLSVGEESVGQDSVAEKKSSPCLQTVRKSRMKCVVKLKKLDPNVICNACNISTAQLKQSENSCVPAKGHDESCGNSDGRRKRKRVPENERNGDPNDPGLLPRLPSQMEPVHFTRSKKKELEMMLNERSKSAEVPPSKDTVTEVIEILSSEGEAASEGESKNHAQEQEDNDKDSDTVNDNTCTTEGLENDPVIPTEYEDNTDLNPVICSIVGNAEIRDTSGPIIVSAESIYEEDYIEGEGRKYVNGCRTKSHIYNDISDNDSPIVSSPEKSVHSNTERSYEASEETSAAEDSEESPRRKRRRILTDKDSDRVNSVPELDDFINNLPLTYFNPELEHRYWCVWRLHVAECMKDCCGWQKGWELYMTAIQEGLKLLNAKKTAVSEFRQKTNYKNSKVTNCSVSQQQ